MSISVREQWTRIGHSQTIRILGSNEKAKASNVQILGLYQAQICYHWESRAQIQGRVCLLWGQEARMLKTNSPQIHTHSAWLKLRLTRETEIPFTTPHMSLAPSNKHHQSTAAGEAIHTDTPSLWHGYEGTSQSWWYSRNTEKDLLAPQTPLSGQVNSRPTAKGIWSLWYIGVMISPKKSKPISSHNPY